MISHERPESQLGARLPLCPAKGRVHASHLGMRFAEAADEDLAQLVRECWHKLPKRRPTFQEVRHTARANPGAWARRSMRQDPSSEGSGSRFLPILNISHFLFLISG